MGVINDPTTGTNIARVGETATGATGALHASSKPVRSSLGHFRVNHRPTTAVWAAGNRIFQFRNPAPDRLAVMTRFVVKIQPIGGGAAADRGQVQFFKVKNFTAMDGTNNTTLTPSSKRSGQVALCQMEGVTALGTGGSGFAGTQDSDSSGVIIGDEELLAIPTLATFPWLGTDMFDDVNGTHPWTFALNEGFTIVPVGGSGGTLSVYFDLSWTEILLPTSY